MVRHHRAVCLVREQGVSACSASARHHSQHAAERIALGPSPAITGIHLAPRMPLARRRMARKTVVVQPRAAALQDAERAYEFKAQAESAYAAASKLVPAVEDAKRQAAELKLKAEIAERNAREAEAHAATIVPEANTAIRELRILAADIRGDEGELTTTNLDCLATQLLNEWLMAHPTATEYKVLDKYEVGIGGVKGATLVGRVAAVEEGGKRWALVSFAVGERVPAGQLRGVGLHWGCAAKDGWGWEPPPRGWTSAPDESKEAGKGGQAWYTPFRCYVPTFLDEPVTLLTSYSCALQLPLDGVIAEGGGLSFVLKRPSGSKPEWLRNATQRDFYLSCKPVAEYFAALDKEDQEDDAHSSNNTSTSTSYYSDDTHNNTRTSSASSSFELSSDVQRLLEKDFRSEAYARSYGDDAYGEEGNYPEDDFLEDKVQRLIQEVEQSTIETLMPSDKPVSFEDLPVSIADFISAIWGPKNTLLNGKLGSSPAVTKMAAKLLNQRTLERLTGTGRGAEGPPREDEGPSRRDDWGSRSGSSSSDDEYWSSSSRWDDDEPSRSDPRDNSSYRRSSSPSSSNNNNGSSGATRRKKKRSTLTRRLAPYVVSANTLLNKWTPLHTKGPSENEELVGQFRSAVHLVDVALMQAAPSMQLGSNTTVGPTNLSRLEAMRSKAEAIVESARELIYDAEGCSVEADVARKEADQLSRMAVEAQDMSVQLQKSAEEAVRVARKAIARLKGKEEEVSIQDLHQVAAERLLAAVNQVQLAPPLLESSGSGGAGGGGVGGAAGSVPDLQTIKPTVAVSDVHGLDGRVVAHAMPTRVGDQHFVVVSVAAAEVFPEGGLDGCLLHWGCVPGYGGKWHVPPVGWFSEPERSFEQGSAWQTPLKKVPAPGYEDREDISVHVATLVLPLYPHGPTNGIDFVIKSPQDQWLARQEHDGRKSNFYIDFYEAAQAVRGAVDVAGMHADEEALKVSADRFAELAGVSVDTLTSQVSGIKRKQWDADALIIDTGDLGSMRGWGVADWMVDNIAHSESKAERSLMHRFDICTDLLQQAMDRNDVQMPLLALAVWLRYSSARFLCWNKNYNVKPREISAAQDRLTQTITKLYEQRPDMRDLCLLSLSAIGSGGTGDAGQRIRDEILHIQSKNNAKGGMMEQWHQKLHNNTSPDDVVICEALLAYLRADLDMQVYWDTLHASGIDKQRLASYDRAITQEPDLKPSQKEGLLRDLGAYLLTLKAVHTGADLQAAAARVVGYQQTSVKGRAVNQEPVPGVAESQLPGLLENALVYKELENRGGLQGVDDLLKYLEVLNEARRELREIMARGDDAANGRLRDLLYLDLALVNATRTLVESKLDMLRTASSNPTYLIPLLICVSMFVESVAMSVGGNTELVCCLKELQAIQAQGARPDLFLLAQSVIDRLARALGSMSEHWDAVLSPTAGAVGWRLGIPQHGIDTFSEEVIRGTAFAPLSQLLSLVDPALRQQSGRGNWMVVSPAAGTASGWLRIVDDLASIQHDTFERPTVLLCNHVGGEEEVPGGCTALLTPDSIDVLCHSAVRARNCRVFLATCYQREELQDMHRYDGQFVQVTSSAVDGNVTVQPADPSTATHDTNSDGPRGTLPQLQRRDWCGRWVVGSPEFHGALVGAKSINTLAMSRRLPHWVRQPVSLALPFGTFEQTLDEEANARLKGEIERRNEALRGAGVEQLPGKLQEIRELVMQLHSPEGLREMFRDWCFDSNVCYPGWEPCWDAIRKVWASQWNDRAYIALDKAGLDHSRLQMAVLVQPVVPAEYAFVAHTMNPTTRDENELYFELVKGFGETLVGNYPGSAMRVAADKAAVKRDLALRDYKVQYSRGGGDDSSACRVLSYPSKSAALMIEANECDGVMIFRSDSNGEDLEGYAGAGLFDSIMTRTPALVPVNYSADRLMCDDGFQRQVLNSIAAACVEIETLMGEAQDIEGVVMQDGSLYVVQTRPQV